MMQYNKTVEKNVITHISLCLHAILHIDSIFSFDNMNRN